jgi:hypothetical protein
MKCGVLVFGQYRALDIAIKSWSFKDHFDCNFYVSTWNETHLKNDPYNIDLKFPVTHELIEKYIPGAIINIEEDPNTDNRTFNRMVYHWKKSLELLIQSNKEYDIIILTRFDNFFAKFDWSVVNKNNFYSYGGHSKDYGDLICPSSLSDFCFIGNKEAMISFINGIEEEPDNHLVDIHKYIPLKITELKLPFDLLTDLYVIMVRPNCFNLHPRDHNYNTIKNLFYSWEYNNNNNIDEKRINYEVHCSY